MLQVFTQSRKRLVSQSFKIRFVQVWVKSVQVRKLSTDEVKQTLDSAGRLHKYVHSAYEGVVVNRTKARYVLGHQGLAGTSVSSDCKALWYKALYWAIQDPNTPAVYREKPHVSTGGAAKSAAENAVNQTESPADSTGEHSREAAAMLARLPLTDAERAEAIRRLLAGAEGD